MAYRNDTELKNAPTGKSGTATNIHGEKINFLGDNKIYVENRNLKNLARSERNETEAKPSAKKPKNDTLSKIISYFVAIVGAAVIGIVSVEPITSLFGGGLLPENQIFVSFSLYEESNGVSYEVKITDYKIKDELTVILEDDSQTIAKHLIIMQSPDEESDENSYEERRAKAEEAGYEIYYGETSEEDNAIFFYGEFFEIDIETKVFGFNIYDGSRLIYKTELSASAIADQDNQ